MNFFIITLKSLFSIACNNKLISLVLLMIVYTVLVILIKSCKVTKHSVSNQYNYIHCNIFLSLNSHVKSVLFVYIICFHTTINQLKL